VSGPLAVSAYSSKEGRADDRTIVVTCLANIMISILLPGFTGVLTDLAELVLFRSLVCSTNVAVAGLLVRRSGCVVVIRRHLVNMCVRGCCFRKNE
jgi:hypothetical protein